MRSYLDAHFLVHTCNALTVAFFPNGYSLLFP